MEKARMLGYQKTGAPNAKAGDAHWQVKRGPDVFCHGPKETFPGVGERKMLRDAGYNLLVNGKTWKDKK